LNSWIGIGRVQRSLTTSCENDKEFIKEIDLVPVEQINAQRFYYLPQHIKYI